MLNVVNRLSKLGVEKELCFGIIVFDKKSFSGFIGVKVWLKWIYRIEGEELEIEIIRRFVYGILL